MIKLLQIARPQFLISGLTLFVFGASWAILLGALFTREDGVEAAWAVVEPVLKIHHQSILYKRDSWGPKEADALIAIDGGWHNPLPVQSNLKLRGMKSA